MRTAYCAVAGLLAELAAGLLAGLLGRQSARSSVGYHRPLRAPVHRVLRPGELPARRTDR